MSVDKQLICHCAIYIGFTCAACGSLLTYVLCKAFM